MTSGSLERDRKHSPTARAVGRPRSLARRRRLHRHRVRAGQARRTTAVAARRAAQPVGPPAVAVIVVLPIQRPRPASIPEYLGIWPLRPVARTLLLCVASIIGGVLLIIIGVFLAAALGVVRLDLVDFSGFRDVIEQTTGNAASRNRSPKERLTA